MSNFTEPLIVTQLENGKWKTERSFKYYVGEEGGDEEIIVPEGFLTDFYSVPFPFRAILPKSQKGNQASVLHDYLYSVKGVTVHKTYTRKEADKIFLEAMGVLGVPKWKRNTMFAAVRAFGPRWRNDENQDK